jgi:hypothetical protein
MKRNRYRPLTPSRQQRFEFTRDGPRLPMATVRECQALLARLLVEVFRGESDERTEESP